MQFKTRNLIGVCALGLGLPLSAQAEPEFPRVSMWTAYDTGSTYYIQASALGGLLKEHAGSNIRIIPGRNDIARMTPLKSGQADYTMSGIAAYFAQEGVMLFNSQKWGPQPLRVVAANFGNQAIGLAAAGDADIETPADLEGKKIVYVLGGDAMNMTTAAVLAYGGLTWDDVRKVEVGSPLEAIDAVLDGTADAMPGSTGNPLIERLTTSPRGHAWVQLPNETPKQQEKWEQVQEVAPFYRSITATEGNAVSEEEPWYSGGYALPIMATMANQEADEVYALVKFLNEHYDQLNRQAPSAEGWNLESQDFTWIMPYHEGVIRYFEEQGVWTDEYQKHQDELIRRQEVLSEAWQQYMASIGSNDFQPVTWSEQRLTALEDAGLAPGLR
ncbi:MULTISPECIES: TAXI family TRAP transporter solute-binding subunit [Halomonadaceae]|uniref:TAXI family TRAP transporter solute-binding subunit n=2 Tax=Vreelandella TaxID=3137766 RepID=A0A7Z0LQ05_9GAMM|nr:MULTISPECIES: TAXI family TRAP transporter solute-binding subunit [Halomonas]NYS76465.1 TAXI family TRAP transporter solute-binding subunit [Halomonas glaciei]